MKTKRILLSAFLAVISTVALAAAPKTSPESVGLASAELAEIGAVMQQKIAAGRMIGGFGLVARHGKVVYAEAWGLRDREASLPMTLDTVVRMFSMSKPITSVGILMLVEQGKLSLNDPVSKYISQLGGLAGTANDYLRFAQMLLDGGGKLLSKDSVALMMQNHQPRPQPVFGLGLGINDVPGKAGKLYGCGGAAGTRFWLDPERDMVTIFGTQLYPGGGKRKAEVRDTFLEMVYQAVGD